MSAVRFTREEVEECLSEAIREHERDPRTPVWASFWDRLTEGEYIPEMPEGA